MKTLQTNFFLITLAALTVACGSVSEKTPHVESLEDDPADSVVSDGPVNAGDKPVNKAVAILKGASGSNLTGQVTFTQQGNGTVRLELTITDAEPGKHAIHLHENGDCSALDASSAGGHWNPTGKPHGKREADDSFHKGDITNITVNDAGEGTLDITVSGWSIGGADDSNILNKAVIIHAGADDFESQPSGNAGPRVACGVIRPS